MVPYKNKYCNAIIKKQNYKINYSLTHGTITLTSYSCVAYVVIYIHKDFDIDNVGNYSIYGNRQIAKLLNINNIYFLAG